MRLAFSGKIHENIEHFSRSIFNSYAQVFFSDNRAFAVLLIVISFIDPWAGFTGLIAVTTTSVLAFSLNLDKLTVSKGLYGFNSLLAGIGLGMYYVFSWHLLALVMLAGLFSLLIAVAMQGIIGKYQLPFLSIPFLITIWIFFVASSGFTTLGLSERGIYNLNEYYSIGGITLVNWYEHFSTLPIPVAIRAYLVSLSAIFFQFNVLAGFLIAAGLLIFSRIAFSLSVIGFTTAYLFYKFIGIEITPIDYSYIGFNYILTSIALGGFFLIPSARSYVSVVILTPLVAITTLSLATLLANFQLPVYSLPFSLITLLYLYVLKFRVSYNAGLSEVFYQFNSPEKNLYTFRNHQSRFRFSHLPPIEFPFYGIWKVTQAHNGQYTHKKDWKHAFDFVIANKSGEQYEGDGNQPADYYCFGKPVIAVADGVIEKVENDIEDNVIGQVNLMNNWGNTVIIKHAEHIYSKVSHLKKGSVDVKEGQKVSRGQILGRCGNSGRSPYPHLHFQMQPYPYIGSVTMDYAICNYVLHHSIEQVLLEDAQPSVDQLISNVEVSKLLKDAFNFIPGQKLTFTLSGEGISSSQVEWQVHVNALNQPYLYCPAQKSLAYFENRNAVFYFTQFHGSRKSLLYEFFLGCYKIQKGFYKGVTLTDYFPLHQHFPGKWLWIQDFIAPFFIFCKTQYKLTYTLFDDSFNSSGITLNSEITNWLGKKKLTQRVYSIKISECGIESFEISNIKTKLILQRCDLENS